MKIHSLPELFNCIFPLSRKSRTAALIVLAACSFHISRAQTQTFSYTGAVQTYTFTGNACVKLKGWGAGGGTGAADVSGNGGTGGGGAYADTVISVGAGSVLQIYTGGGGGFGSGGAGNGTQGAAGWGYGSGGAGGEAGTQGSSGGGGGGGGSSTVLLNGNIVLVAAGGGGGGGSGCQTVGANGGGGGQPGVDAPVGSSGGDGPPNTTATANGAAGVSRGNGDSGGGGGGGGGYPGGTGGGTPSFGGSDCNQGGGAASGGGGTSVGGTIVNGASAVPGNNTDPDLCASCAVGATVPSTNGGNGIVVMTFDVITSTAANSGPVCPGNAINLTGTSTGVTFSWSGPNGFTAATQNSSIAAFTTADTGIYTFIATDNIGCSDTVTTDATTFPTPVASINPPDTLTCAATTVTLTATSSHANSTYVWSDATTASTDNVTQPGNYSVTVTDQNTCTGSATVTVAQDITAPAGAINPPDTLTCSVTSVQLTATSNYTASTFSWSNNTTTNPTSVSSPGNYNVTITATVNGCTLVQGIPVLQDITPPVAAINPPDTLTCAVTTVTLTATSNYTNSTYLWSDNTSNSTDNVSSTGPFTVTVTASINGCTASASVTVPQIPHFTDTFSTSPALCFGQASGSAQVTLNGGTAPITYIWSSGATTATADSLTAGSYSVTIADANQCTAVISNIQITQPTQIAITLTPGIETCYYSSDATLGDTVTGGTPGYTYAWSNNATTQNLTNLAPGAYTVTVTDANNCTMSADTTIIPPAPLVLAAAVNNPSCSSLPPNGDISLAASGSPPPYQFVWSTGATDSLISSLDTGTYMVTVTDANNCTMDSTFTLTYTYQFTVQASPAVTIHLGDSTSISYAVNGNPGSFTSLWNPEYSLACPTCSNTAAYPVRTTQYQVVITDSVGCTASDTVSVIVIPDYPVYIPNVFSPNGNGSNDYFQVFGKKETWQFFEIQIFDRWGERVYQSTDENFQWDGSFKGKALYSGVYVYEMRIVFIDDHTDKLFTGSITLLR